MKAIPALLALAISAIAAPNEPGEAAIGFLEKVRANNFDLKPGRDTALSPQTSETKRREITRQLELMAAELGTGPLEVGPTKQDGELAAVLIRKNGGFDPAQLQVFSIALIKQNKKWLPAPVAASFENTGARYIPGLRKRLQTLENWMLRERVLDLQTIQTQSTDRMRRSIRKTLPASTLHEFNSKQTAERFLTACENRNRPEILGLLGGISQVLPADWSLRIKAVNAALESVSGSHPAWRLLTSPHVLRVLVDHEELTTQATVSIACLDPSGDLRSNSRAPIQLVHLELTKTSEGFWRIDPPQSLLVENNSTDKRFDDDLDGDLLDAFAENIFAQYPPKPGSTADQIRQSLRNVLQKGELDAFMPLIRLDSAPETARNACIQAARIWWMLRNPSELHCAVPLEFRQDAEKAVASFQFFSVSESDSLNLQFMYFEKFADGWYWTPEPRTETKNFFRGWKERQSKQWKETWRNELLAECIVIESLSDSGSVPEKEARTLVESWLTAIGAGDVLTAASLTARLDTPDSQTKLIWNLGYEINGFRRNTQPPTITGVRCGESLTIVGVVSHSDNRTAYPLYTVVKTPGDPKILLEADLFSSGNRSREYLNKLTFKHLQKINPQLSTDLLKAFHKFQKENKRTPPP